jgi:precorrin-6B methylase 1
MNNPDERADVPVLTQIVEDEAAARPPAVDAAALEALARQLERAVLERLGAEIERVTGEALETVRAELTASVTQMVREAVAASVAHALAPPKRD